MYKLVHVFTGARNPNAQWHVFHVFTFRTLCHYPGLVERGSLKGPPREDALQAENMRPADMCFEHAHVQRLSIHVSVSVHACVLHILCIRVWSRPCPCVHDHANARRCSMSRRTIPAYDSVT